MFLKLIGTQGKQGKIFGVCSVVIRVMSREHLYVTKASSFLVFLSFIDVVRHTKSDQDNLEEIIIDGRSILSDKLERIHAIPRPEQASTPRLFMGGWQIHHNASHIGTTNDLARSVVISVQMCSKESKASLGD